MRRNIMIYIIITCFLILVTPTLSATDTTNTQEERITNYEVSVTTSQELLETINEPKTSSENLNIKLESPEYEIGENDLITLDSEKTYNTLNIDGNNNKIRVSDQFIEVFASKTLILKNIVFTGNPRITNHATTEIINCTFKDIEHEFSILDNYDFQLDYSVMDEYNDIPDEIPTEGILEIYNSTIINVNNFIANDGSRLTLSNNIIKNCNNLNSEYSFIRNYYTNITISNNTFYQNNYGCLFENYDEGNIENIVLVKNNTFDSNGYSDSLINTEKKIHIEDNYFINNKKLSKKAILVKIDSQEESSDELRRYNNTFGKLRKDNISSKNKKSLNMKKYQVAGSTLKKDYVHEKYQFKHGEKVTLSRLCDLFAHDFTNSHMLIYLNDKLIFNSTVTDDLSYILFRILDEYNGQYTLKIVDSDNKTFTKEIKIN